MTNCIIPRKNKINSVISNVNNIITSGNIGMACFYEKYVYVSMIKMLVFMKVYDCRIYRTLLIPLHLPNLSLGLLLQSLRKYN